MLGIQAHHRQQAFVLDHPRQKTTQDRPVDGVEEFAHIQMQGVTLAGVLSQRLLHVIRATMGALALAAGITMVNEGAVEQGIDDAIDGVLRDHIPEGRGQDQARLALLHDKTKIGPRSIGPGQDFRAQLGQVRPQALLKLKDRPLGSLTFARVQIGRVQVLGAKAAVEEVAVALHERSAP